MFSGKVNYIVFNKVLCYFVIFFVYEFEVEGSMIVDFIIDVI